ncbi:hypothetical protein MAR_030700 [Mya arenaria]|uniref:Uncharacterized protein n=1 Tax=Mya arenaria TaxID=6604 RepID=A0ABY7F9W2_MYAAR|nr:uncharacterized protein LOC128206142 [Mya arenaria]XP_052764379.1 uncharacterized protein LOC128206142 [Mya arenaria]WAR16106.1 hypothetical protein MAR_030700 [Mya arenaria]
MHKAPTDAITTLVTKRTKKFVEIHFRNFHHEIIKSVQGETNAECGKCTLRQLLDRSFTCPKLICDKIRDHIKLSHRHTSPSWSNTTPPNWCNSHWEIAKCFLPESDTNARTTSAEDVNLLELIDCVCNCKYFDRLKGTSTASESVPIQLRDILIRKKTEKTLLDSEENYLLYQKTLEEFLTVITPHTLQHTLPELIQFAKQYPKLSRSLSTQSSDDFKDFIKTGKTYNSIECVLPKPIYRRQNSDEDAPIASTSIELPRTSISLPAVENIDITEGVRRQKRHLPFPTNIHREKQSQEWLDILYEGNRNAFKKECSHICQDIKSSSPNILDVYAAIFDRSDKPRQTAFVATVSKDQEHDITYSNHNIVMKVRNRYEAEGNIVANSEITRRNRLSPGDQSKLKQHISELSPRLMQKHKYLNMITASGVRSRGFGKAHTIDPEVCIVLYVHAKGYIPIDEMAFERSYHDIPVDIREGGFWGFNETVRIGDAIFREGVGLAGSLGGFFEHPSLGLCGITSAHAVLKPKELKQCMEDGRFPANKEGEIYQIKTCNDLFNIGRLVMAFYAEGNDQDAGVELAVFVIDSSLSSEQISVSFEGINRQGQPATFSFETGKSLGSAYFYPDYHCCKYGSATTFTSGEISSDFDNDGLLSIKEMKFDELKPLVLHKQYEIAPLAENMPFADFGDSGAFVYCWRSTCDLVCVGMIVGGTSNGTTVVTPINSVLKQLGVPKLKNFKKLKNEQLLKHLDAKVDRLESKFDTMQSGINQLLHRLNQSSRTGPTDC